ncbi:MAG: S-layer homology domain-containing protein [Oscillospiraceae bacterium]|nr:S-layer homology domain-containing protein [Oscillospiraceae bacterium]
MIKRKIAPRLMAIMLTGSILLSTAAGALTIEQARALIEEHYVDQISEEALSQETVEGLIAALGDPYTVYYTEEEYQNFLGNMVDTVIVGIGISFALQDGAMQITRVVEGSPAEEAGLQAGDTLVSIDGNVVEGADVDTVSEWLKNEEGTKVALVYERGGKQKKVTVTRRQVLIPETTTQLDGAIGYISCNTFGEDTAAHFEEGINAYNMSVDTWLVDLRANSGGVMSAACDALGFFVGKVVTGYIRNKDGVYQTYGSKQDVTTVQPIITIVGAGTASAAEMFAAETRELGAGITVGGRTYGKGTAQVIYDESTDPEIFTDGDAMKISAYRFFTTNGNALSVVGVIPNLIVDEAIAPAVATLLAGSKTDESKTGILHIKFGWNLYVNLDTATAEENREAFAALLSALPASVELYEKIAGSDDLWVSTDVAAVAAKYNISYNDRTFTDCADSEYADVLDVLAIYGILQGTGDGQFEPEKSLTRAELAQMLAQALNCKQTAQSAAYDGESRFADVAADAWYGAAVNEIAAMGLVEGTGGGMFHPDTLVTHAEFITIMGRLSSYLNLYMYEFYHSYTEEDGADTRLAAYPDWAKQSTWLLACSQTDVNGNSVSLLWDDADAIDPDAATSRESAAVVLYSLLSYTGILPA